jgi:hypothetical protein
MNRQIHRAIILFTFALLIQSSATAQHFPADKDLKDLIRTRVEEDRAIGIVLGVLEAEASILDRHELEELFWPGVPDRGANLVRLLRI